MSNYRNLKVWQRARGLSRRVHLLLRKLPPEERIQRGDHLVKTTTQIRAAIAEGSSHESPRQFARLLTYAIGSADELGDELQELIDIDVMPIDDRDLPDECHQIAAMLVELRKVVLRANGRRRRNRVRNEESSK
jgi:four helix bundle protein